VTRPPHRIFLGKDHHKFNGAHMTVFPDGTKERLHGHSFQVSVAVDLRDVSFAAFLDFAVVKAALEAQCREWNERLILAERCPFMTDVRREGGEVELRLCGKRYVVPEEDVLWLPIDNVVVETLAIEFARALAARLGPALRRDVVAGLEVEITESARQGGAYYLAL
jgi:6-pyruvoyltetrahydropterin/6-carboxytetrahydropterin synthase